MTKVYFVRHCESVANRDGILQGTKEFDISPEGQKQLELLKERFKETEIDKIYSSPLSRTYKTALAVRGERDIEIEKEKGFIEFDFGDIQGMSIKEFEKSMPDQFECFKNKFYEMDAPGGQTYRDFYETAYRTLFEKVSENPGKTIVIVSHGGTIRAIFTKLLYDDITKVHHTPKVVNTAVFEVDFYKDGNFDVKMVNDDSHLDKKAVVRLEI